jgi:hypothetical protein
VNGLKGTDKGVNKGAIVIGILFVAFYLIGSVKTATADEAAVKDKAAETVVSDARLINDVRIDGYVLTVTAGSDFDFEIMPSASDNPLQTKLRLKGVSSTYSGRAVATKKEGISHVDFLVNKSGESATEMVINTTVAMKTVLSYANKTLTLTFIKPEAPAHEAAPETKPETWPEIRPESKPEILKETPTKTAAEKNHAENSVGKADDKKPDKKPMSGDKKPFRGGRSLEVKNLDEAKNIIGVDVRQSGDGAEVTVSADGLLMPDIFPLSKRLVIDIPKTRLLAKTPPVGYGPVKAVRWAQYPDKTRIVLDLHEGASYKTALGGRTIIAVVMPKNGSAAVKTDFKGREASSETHDGGASNGRNGKTVETAGAVEQNAADKNTDKSADKNAAAEEYEPGVISLEFQNADLVSVIRFIIDVSGYNVVVDSRIRGRVTLKLAEVPWEDALDAIIDMYGLNKECKDNIIRITPTEEHLKGFANACSDGRGCPDRMLNGGRISVNMDLAVPKAITSETGKIEEEKPEPEKEKPKKEKSAKEKIEPKKKINGKK